MVRNLMATWAFCLSLLGAQSTQAQVQVGMDPNEGSVRSNRQSRPDGDQLDRIEDKLDMLTRQMDRVEKKLGSRPNPGKTYEVTSSVDNDCVTRIYEDWAEFNSRVEMTQRCRSGNLSQLQSTCRQLSKTSDATCFNQLVENWYSSVQKADLIDACATYVFECNGK